MVARNVPVIPAHAPHVEFFIYLSLRPSPIIQHANHRVLPLGVLAVSEAYLSWFYNGRGARSSDRDSSKDGMDQSQRGSHAHRALSSLEGGGELRRPSVDTDAGNTPRALPSSKDGGAQKGGEFPFMQSLLRILGGPTGACYSATPAIEEEEEEETGGSQSGRGRSTMNDQRPAVALTIMCHSAKLSSAAKHTVGLGKDATVQDLCVEFAREIPDGLVVCEVPGKGFTTTFLLTRMNSPLSLSPDPPPHSNPPLPPRIHFSFTPFCTILRHSLSPSLPLPASLQRCPPHPNFPLNTSSLPSSGIHAAQLAPHRISIQPP